MSSIAAFQCASSLAEETSSDPCQQADHGDEADRQTTTNRRYTGLLWTIAEIGRAVAVLPSRVGDVKFWDCYITFCYLTPVLQNGAARASNANIPSIAVYSRKTDTAATEHNTSLLYYTLAR